MLKKQKGKKKKLTMYDGLTELLKYIDVNVPLLDSF